MKKKKIKKDKNEQEKDIEIFIHMVLLWYVIFNLFKNYLSSYICYTMFFIYCSAIVFVAVMEICLIQKRSARNEIVTRCCQKLTYLATQVMALKFIYLSIEEVVRKYSLTDIQCLRLPEKTLLRTLLCMSHQPIAYYHRSSFR